MHLSRGHHGAVVAPVGLRSDSQEQDYYMSEQELVKGHKHFSSSIYFKYILGERGCK